MVAPPGCCCVLCWLFCMSLFEFEETFEKRDCVAWAFPDDDLHDGASYRYGDSTVYAEWGWVDILSYADRRPEAARGHRR